MMAIDERELFEAVELEMSSTFRSRLERDLVAVASAESNDPNPDVSPTRGLQGARPTGRRSRWVTASAAALVVAVAAGITAIRLSDPPRLDRAPTPTTVATTPSTSSTTSVVPDTTSAVQEQPPNFRDEQRGSSAEALNDVYAIDLDRWLDGAPPWSTTDHHGPYLIFDIQHLPSGWSVTSVAGSHPLNGGPAQYQWAVQLSSTQSIDATLRVERWGGTMYPGDTTKTEIRGRDAREGIVNGMASITWLEEEPVQAWLTSPTPTALPELHAARRSIAAGLR